MLPWDDAVEGYWLSKRQNLSKHTITDYARTFRRFGDWIDGRDVQKIKPGDVNGFLLHLSEDLGLAGKTCANSWIALSSMWSWLHKEFDCNKIMKNVERPKYRKKPPDPFTMNEVKRLISACYAMSAYVPAHDCYIEGRRPTAARDVAFIVLLVSTGLRANELCQLNIGDYSKDRGKITVIGKGDKTRILFVGNTAMQRIWRYLLVRGHKHLTDDDPLFANMDGSRMTPNGLFQMIQRAGERADVRHAHPHRFRHTFAINFLRNGGSVFELKEMLGHEKLTTVLIYAQLAEVDLEIAQRRSNVADAWKL